MQQLTWDWNERFQAGDTPWEDPEVPPCTAELIREFALSGATVFEVGCGSGSADNVDQPGDRARLGLPRLTLGEVAGAVETHFEILIVRRGPYGAVRGRTDILARVSALRRRAEALTAV